jgi:hypothetical protein
MRSHIVDLQGIVSHLLFRLESSKVRLELQYYKINVEIRPKHSGLIKGAGCKILPFRLNFLGLSVSILVVSLKVTSQEF